MSSDIAKIEVYPDYNPEGDINLDLPFFYGCPELDLMGYADVIELIKDIKEELQRIDLENKE